VKETPPFLQAQLEAQHAKPTYAATGNGSHMRCKLSSTAPQAAAQNSRVKQYASASMTRAYGPRPLDTAALMAVRKSNQSNHLNEI
jgi:hypothetical protein